MGIEKGPERRWKYKVNRWSRIRTGKVYTTQRVPFVLSLQDQSLLARFSHSIPGEYLCVRFSIHIGYSYLFLRAMASYLHIEIEVIYYA